MIADTYVVYNLDYNVVGQSNYKFIKVRFNGRSGVRTIICLMPTGVLSGYSTLKFRMMCAIAMCSTSSATRRPAGKTKRGRLMDTIS